MDTVFFSWLLTLSEVFLISMLYVEIFPARKPIPLCNQMYINETKHYLFYVNILESKYYI